MNTCNLKLLVKHCGLVAYLIISSKLGFLIVNECKYLQTPTLKLKKPRKMSGVRCEIYFKLKLYVLLLK